VCLFRGSSISKFQFGSGVVSHVLYAIHVTFLQRLVKYQFFDQIEVDTFLASKLEARSLTYSQIGLRMSNTAETNVPNTFIYNN
jgi:hypothetical protein